jgi:hypothetical protein
MRTKRSLLVIGMAVLVAAGCAARPGPPVVHSRPQRPVVDARHRGPDELVVHLVSGLDRPTATLSFQRSTQDASVGSYCWSHDQGGMCADTTLEYVLVGSHLVVPPGTVLRIEGDPAEISGRLGTVVDHGNHDVQFDSVQTLSLGQGFDHLQADPGEYTLDLFARWGGGDAALAFGITIAGSA